jgi:hypothetical protein
MDTYKRAGRAQKAVSRLALRELGVPEPGLKAAGASQRCMPKPKIAKGRTREEQQRIDADNAAMAAAARRREQALRQEQKARRRALAQAKHALAPDTGAKPDMQARAGATPGAEGAQARAGAGKARAGA